MKIFKNMIKSVSSILPYAFKLKTLRFLAALPPVVRTYFLYSYAQWLATQVDQNTVIKTNMGISHNLSCKIPIRMESCVIWGKPQYYTQEWTSMKLTAILSNYCDAFIDIGSYVGYYAFFVRNHLPKNKPIYYFEPIPEYFQVIQDNVAESQLSLIYGYNFAVGHRDSITKFYKNLTHSTCGSLTNRYVDRHKVDEITVSMIKFDTLIEQTQLNNVCVKVDIEGAESLFLEGAKHSLAKIKFLIIEVLDVNSEFLQKMQNDYGYEIYHILPNSLKYCPNGTDEYVHNQWNWLCCKNRPDELKELIKSSELSIVT